MCNFYCMYKTDKFMWGLHNRWLETSSGHTLRTSPWLSFKLFTAKLWLSRLPFEILPNWWFDLKKKGAIKEVIKILFCVFYNFCDFKKLKCCFGAQCNANIVIKLEIKNSMPLKAEVRLQLIQYSALEGGSFLTQSCGLSTSGKEPLPIVLVDEWASWPFW